MRVKEELKLSGYFWLPGRINNKIPGTLFISDGGEIVLDIVGSFDESIDGFKNMFTGDAKLERINGHVEKFGLVTLDGCIYKNRNISFSGISKSSVYVSSALLEVSYDEDEKIMINAFQFSIEGLDEWVGISGIKVDYSQGVKEMSITYELPEKIQLNLANDITLSIVFEPTYPGFPCIKDAKISQKVYFVIKSEQALPIENFINIAFKITTLLCFAIDRSVSIDNVLLTSESLKRKYGEDLERYVVMKYFWRSRPFSKNVPEINLHDMLFRFEQVYDKAEKIINNWLLAYDNIEPAMNLYFSAKVGDLKYLESRFLALVQGIETYHRRIIGGVLMNVDEFDVMKEELLEKCDAKYSDWLSAHLKYGNEMPLAKRINAVLLPYKDYFGNKKGCKKLVRDVVDTRNYLTHYDESLRERYSKGKDLWDLILKLEAVFELQLLQVLGFTINDIRAIVEKSSAFAYKINNKKA
jgi:hypothetical protein